MSSTLLALQSEAKSPQAQPHCVPLLTSNFVMLPAHSPWSRFAHCAQASGADSATAHSEARGDCVARQGANCRSSPGEARGEEAEVFGSENQSHCGESRVKQGVLPEKDRI